MLRALGGPGAQSVARATQRSADKVASLLGDCGFLIRWHDTDRDLRTHWRNDSGVDCRGGVAGSVHCDPEWLEPRQRLCPDGWRVLADPRSERDRVEAAQDRVVRADVLAQPVT